ncbi:MAG: prepilin-type N-terminal cleavage/methylation domain-containing protein [Burkholderiales bacterium]
METKRNQSGFTLIEIAIVLVIVGLLLGGVLKGQELINNARVRNVIALSDGIKAAYFGFQDRYRGIAGDYPITLAQQNIPGGGSVQGCTAAAATCQDGTVTNNATDSEAIIAWNQLSFAGYITGSYDGAGGTPTTQNTPTNPFGGFMQLIFDNDYTGTATAATNIKTGNNIPAATMAEIDRKIDDGNPDTGVFRSGSAFGTPDAACRIVSGAIRVWDAAGNPKNCAGVHIF